MERVAGARARLTVSADETDSLMRAVAAVPSVEPPARQVTTIAISSVDDPVAIARLPQLTAPFRAELVSRPDSAFLTFAGADSATRAASCALMLHDAFPRARMAIATGQTASIDRALGLLVSGNEAIAIHIDAATADLVERSFELKRSATGGVLFGSRTASSGSALVDTSALETSRSGLRFVSRNTEAAYRDWHRAKAIRFTRLGGYLALLSWTASLVGIHIARPESFGATAKLAPPSILLIIAAIAISFRRRLLHWMLRTAALASAVSGLSSLAVCWLALSMVEFGIMGTLLCSFFAFAILRLLPVQAGLAAAPYFLCTEWMLVDVFAADRLDWSALVLYSVVLWFTFLAGLIACVTVDLVNRGAYRQERIVEAQREIIDRMQRRELQRQVAERSRGLSEALSRLTDTPRTTTRFAPGDIVEERYRIVRAIGRGGMGQVHEIERLTDGRRLALKTLTGVAHREALARFAREAQVAAELDHPNVVAALDIGVTRSGTLFLVMELVTGTSLAAERNRFADAQWALPVLLQVARALAAMHARGIVHRDLKPSNILIDGSNVKVADFGLAGLIDQAPLAETRDAVAPTAPALTQTGAIMGTPLYMAPELVEGARAAGPSADIFSLGVVAYELLANELPFGAPPILERLGGRSAPKPKSLALTRPTLPPELCALVDSCLVEAPSARPSGELIAATLERLL